MMNIYGMYVSNIAVCIHSSLIWEGKYFDPGANCDQDRLLGQSATPPLHGVISQIRHHTVQCSSGSKVNILNVFEEFLENVLISNKYTLVQDKFTQEFQINGKWSQFNFLFLKITPKIQSGYYSKSFMIRHHRFIKSHF